MQLLGEQINAKISMLAGGRRSSDTDNLARTTLKYQQITHADMVAWNGDRIGAAAEADIGAT
jgi:hypothetical protein